MPKLEEFIRCIKPGFYSNLRLGKVLRTLGPQLVREVKDLREQVARAQGSLCSMRDGFHANGEDNYAARTQHVIELLMGGTCPKGGDHIPIPQFNRIVCEKCGLPLGAS